MNLTHIIPNRTLARRGLAFTLVEVVVALAITALILISLVNGYIQSNRRAEWSAYSLAAQSLALQRLEQARACKWDPEATPAVDELVATNFLTQINLLDIPYSGTNFVYATNITVVSSISTTPPLKQIQVECTWQFINGIVYTNSVVAYRSPDS